MPWLTNDGRAGLVSPSDLPNPGARIDRSQIATVISDMEQAAAGRSNDRFASTGALHSEGRGGPDREGADAQAAA